MMTHRQQRLADEIRDTIGQLFAGGQLSDPRLDGVSITAVKLSGDLQIATVYFRTYNDTIPVEDIHKGLDSASGLMRRKLAGAIDVRRIPELKFFFDKSIERANRIESLLATIKE
jgi:ribosome-binding factor A